MRTTLDLPEKLLVEALKASGARTKTQAIIWGLEALVKKKKYENLWNLRGKIAPLEIDLRKSRAR